MGYRFIFEEELCIGCFACHTACLNAHYEVGEERQSYRTVKQVIRVNEAYQKKVCPGCIHCGACVQVCKSHALYRDTSTGLVLLHQGKCVGCRACETVCPMQVIRYDRESKASKCDGCMTLLNAGKVPACVRNCPVGAIKVEER